MGEGPPLADSIVTNYKLQQRGSVSVHWLLSKKFFEFGLFRRLWFPNKIMLYFFTGKSQFELKNVNKIGAKVENTVEYQSGERGIGLNNRGRNSWHGPYKHTISGAVREDQPPLQSLCRADSGHLCPGLLRVYCCHQVGGSAVQSCTHEQYSTTCSTVHYPIICSFRSHCSIYWLGICVILLRLYFKLCFYGASRKHLHKPRANFGNMLAKINYGYNYYLPLLCLQFLSRTHLSLK